MDEISIEQARPKLGDLVRDAQQHGITTLITRNGKPAAVLVPVEATQPNRRTTERGFTVYDEFTDTYGSAVIVQESSSAEGARVWIFCRHGGFPEKAEEPHLDVEQAKRVRDALAAFISEHAGITT